MWYSKYCAINYMNTIQWETMGDDELVGCLLFFLVQHGAVDFTRGGHHTLAAA